MTNDNTFSTLFEHQKMVAQSEISRVNGAKSRGPQSERGRAIASRNATKHGLLAQRPPLVLGEDLETFQDIMQGLIDEYQPETPTEHLLIQQAAMGWLRLHRLWGVEAAIAKQSMLQRELSTKFPDQIILDLASYNRPMPRSASEKVEIQKLEQQIGCAAIASLGVPDVTQLEKLTRYERHITRTLYDALDRLAAIGQQRQQADSMGSFGQHEG